MLEDRKTYWSQPVGEWTLLRGEVAIVESSDLGYVAAVTYGDVARPIQQTFPVVHVLVQTGSPSESVASGDGVERCRYPVDVTKRTDVLEFVQGGTHLRCVLGGFGTLGGGTHFLGGSFEAWGGGGGASSAEEV